MSQEERIDELILELLETGATPEAVCEDCPELLPEVRRGWKEVCALETEINSWFPTSDTDGCAESPEFAAGEMPQIPGYEMLEVLGRGGAGIVYLARHSRLDRQVAVKMLLTGRCAKPRELDRFWREVKALAGLRHPNIVPIYDVGDHDGRLYFTMEFLDGGSLAKKLKGNPLPALKAARLVATLADGIHAAHENGIVHRDLSPSNVLFTADGTPRITDFGLARRLNDDSGLSLSGMALGTPGYMAPEQAVGRSDNVGPRADVYALGAMLYKMLTARPPFQAETTTATIQQLLSEEPVPPSLLNSRTPRDLETICLKCLSKEPQSRYESAASMADDLRRFERGEPVAARRIGHFGRLSRWARRRPALAKAWATCILLALVLTVSGSWWFLQRVAAERAAEVDGRVELREAEQLRQRGDYAGAAAALDRARLRLGKAGPAALHERLDQAAAAVELVQHLEAIRLERALVKPPTELLGVLILPPPEVSKDAHAPIAETGTGRHYEESFREAGIGAPGDDPAVVAARVGASPVREALLAALDDWAACAIDRDQQAWVVAVVRRADPDPWRDSVRDPATWVNPEALRDLAARARVPQQSAQILAVLGARLRGKKLDAVPFLVRVVSSYPADFWVNIEMGNALWSQSNLVEATGYYRTALALRPQTVSLHYALGGLYLAQHRWDESIAEFEQAVRLTPENPWCHNRLGFTLAWKGGHDDEAIAQFREAVRLDANIGWSHYFLAVALERKNCFDEAVDEFREAARLLPEKRAEWERNLRKLLLKLGRGAEARAAWKEELAAHPSNHDDWFGYAELCLFQGDEEEYRRARRELLAQFGTVTDRAVAERVARACLLLPPTEGELRQAVALTEHAVAGGRQGHEFAYPYFLFAQGMARYRQGRFDDAIKLMNGEAASVMGPSPRLVLAMAQFQKGQVDLARKTLAAAIHSYDWSTSKADDHDAWIAHILRREVEALILPELPAPSTDNH